jgi:hypothetical protein
MITPPRVSERFFTTFRRRESSRTSTRESATLEWGSVYRRGSSSDRIGRRKARMLDGGAATWGAPAMSGSALSSSNFELKRANEILHKASAYLAPGRARSPQEVSGAILSDHVEPICSPADRPIDVLPPSGAAGRSYMRWGAPSATTTTRRDSASLGCQPVGLWTAGTSGASSGGDAALGGAVQRPRQWR